MQRWLLALGVVVVGLFLTSRGEAIRGAGAARDAGDMGERKLQAARDAGDMGERKLQINWSGFCGNAWGQTPCVGSPTTAPTFCSDLSYANKLAASMSTSSKEAATCASALTSAGSTTKTVYDKAVQAEKKLNALDANLKKFVDNGSTLRDKLKKFSVLASRVPKVGTFVKTVGKTLSTLVAQASAARATSSESLKKFKYIKNGLNYAQSGLNAAAPKLTTAGTWLGRTSAVDMKAISCANARPTMGCPVTSAITSANREFDNMAYSWFQQPISGCASAIQTLETKVKQVSAYLDKIAVDALNAVIDKIVGALNAIEAALAPVFKAVNDFIGEAYCCNVPFGVQVVADLANKISNLATCPADAVLATFSNIVASALQDLSNAYKALLNEALGPIMPVLVTLREISIAIPIFRLDVSSSETLCTIKFPSFDFETDVYNISPFETVLDNITLTLTAFSYDTSLSSNLKAICTDAVNALAGLPENCCKEFRAPVPDMYPCDATELGPAETGCSMCASERSFIWYDAKGRCGPGQAWPDGVICGEGTTCNNCGNGYSYWYSRAFHYCGQEPCYISGTLCAAGISCGRCCANDYSWSWSGMGNYCD